MQRLSNRILDKLLDRRPTHWLRAVMNEKTGELISRLGPDNRDVCEISGNQWAGFNRFKSYRSLHYPEFDICRTTVEPKCDLIIAEQVFEHLLWPYRAVKNVYGGLKEDGYFLITLPFFVRIHENPVDCTRWTPTGLKYLLLEGGFHPDDIHVDSWGNRACIKANFTRFLPFRKRIHSLKNEPAFPCVVWGLARKRSFTWRCISNETSNPVA